MKKSLIVLAFVAGCGASSQQGGNASGAAPAGMADAESTGAVSDDLTGLYQTGAGTRPDQMCVLQKGGKAQFGLTIWGANLRACSGAGTVTRSGDRLSLKMGGDSPCTLEATLKGGKLAFSSDVPASCAYYCGAGASFAGAALTRIGRTRADALKARDIAGESLCG